MEFAGAFRGTAKKLVERLLSVDQLRDVMARNLLPPALATFHSSP